MKLCLGVRLLLGCLLALPISAAAQSARIVNVSTRGPVGTGDDILFGGLVVSGAPKTVLVRAIGPGLDAFGVPGTLPDPTLAIYDGNGKVVVANDNWNSADGATFGLVGAFPITAGSKDSVIVTTLPPGSYTAQISGLGSPNTGVVILEIYDVSGAGQLVNISTRLRVGTGANAAVAGFVVSPGSGTRKLLVRGIGPALGVYGVAGFLPDPKLQLFDGNGALVASAVANGGVSVLANANAQAGAFPSTGTDAVTIVTVNPGSYTVQLSGNSGTTSGVGLIEVYDITNSTGTPVNLASTTPTLYYASLRPGGAAVTSTASGYATILFDPNTNVATVNVSFSNLSSAITSSHLVLGSPTSGNFVLNLPRGQATDIGWTFPASGASSTADLIAALQNGQISVSLDTASFPTGEAQGSFRRVTGSTTFTPPAPPPALAATALTAPTQTDAARFLTQATFGPTTATINALMSRGINGWIDDQIALPATGATASLRADLTAFPNPPEPSPGATSPYAWAHNWNGVWMKIAATAPDQLRQRVAMALSEIMVVGQSGITDFSFESLTNYYDLLVNRAFGNFRALLEDVTLNPAMGLWLSHVHNLKANSAKGTAPDENYAREVQQLFTIGLVQLQPDGTLMLDSAGLPIPTYNQATIAETAKILTGWSYALFAESNTNESLYINEIPAPAVLPSRLPDTSAFLAPMRYYDAFHDKTAKNIVSLQQVPLADAKPTAVPAGQTGPQDLKILLDTLFNHPNTGPFISRQLIQRLVTSNPSPGYVYRVAQVFANDGTGTRGNLGAVVRAILTDYEARSPSVINNVGYGKIKEPLIRVAQFIRALNVTAANGRYLDGYFGDPRGLLGFFPVGLMAVPTSNFGQGVLQAATVFNFFSPDYSPPGSLAAAGLVAPEMQIIDSSFAVHVPNRLQEILYRDTSSYSQPATGGSPYLKPNYAEFLPNAQNPAALADQLNLLFCANQMTASTRAQIINRLQIFPATATDTERVQAAITVTVIAPDSALQK